MKSATIKTKIRLGVFVICVAALGGFFLLLAGDNASFFKQSRYFKAYFKNASGLIEGAPVRIGGVEVGRVANIAIEAPGQSLAIVATLAIDKPYSNLITRNASVGLETQGLLGDRFVALNPGTSSERGSLPANSVIATREERGLGKVMERSGEIMDQVSHVTSQAASFAAGLPDTAAVEAMTADVQASTQAIRKLIQSLAADDSFVGMLNDPDAKRSLKNTLASMESATARMDSIVKKIDGGQGTLGALVNDRSIYEDMRTVLGRIDRGKIARRVFIEAAEQEGQEKAR